MTILELTLGDDPAAALEALRAASRERVVVVFKASPIWPASHRAEARFGAWRAALGEGADVAVTVIDVIARRALARGLTKALRIRHESPQALVFRDGELVAHDSHGRLTERWFEERV